MAKPYLPPLKKKKEQDKQQTQSVQTLSPAERFYRSPYNKALMNWLSGASETAQTVYPKAVEYANKSQQNTQNIQNSLTGTGMHRPANGDIFSLNDEAMRTSRVDQQQMLNAFTQQGAFDTEGNLTAGNIYLTSQGYRDKVLPTLQTQLETSIAADKERQALVDAWTNGGEKAYLEYTAGKNSFDNWLAQKRGQGGDFDNPTEDDLLYLDRVMNGGTKRSFNWSDPGDVELYNTLYGQWAGTDFNNISYPEYSGMANPHETEYESKTQGIQTQIDAIEAENTRVAAKNAMEADLAAKPTFSTASQYAKPNAKGAGLMYYGFGAPGTEERLYNYINGYWFTDPITHETFDSSSGFTSGVDQNWYGKGYDLLTAQEKAYANAAYAEGRLREYLDIIQPELAGRRRDVQTGLIQTVAENAVAGTLLDIPMAMAKPAGDALSWAGAALGIDDINNPIYAISEGVNAYRETRSGEAENALPGVGSFVYNTATGAEDFILQALSGKGISGVTGGVVSPQSAASALMGLSASGSTITDDIKNGFSTTTAMGHGLANAAIEMISEKLPLDSIFTGDGFLKSGITEALEEAFSGVVDPGVQAVFASMEGKQSEVSQVYNYFKNNLPEGSDPALETLKYYAEDVAQQALSGGIIGSGANIAVNIPVRAENKATGKTIVENNDVDRVLEIGQSMPEDSQSYKEATALKARMDANKRVDLGRLGRLSRALEVDLGDEYSQIITKVADEAIADRMVELGDDAETAKESVGAVKKASTGEALTDEERATLAQTKSATQVVAELAGESEEGVKWTSKMQSRAIEAGAETAGKIGELQQSSRGFKVSNDVAAAEKEATRLTTATKASKGSMTKATVVYDTGSGETTGEIVRFEAGKGGKLDVVVKGDQGEKQVAYADLKHAEGKGVAQVVAWAANNSTKLTAGEANELLHTYKAIGGDAGKFIQTYRNSFDAGFYGEAAPSTKVLPAAVTQRAYEAGKALQQEAERARISRVKAGGVKGSGTVSFIGQVSNKKQVTGQGTTDALKTAMAGMTASQRSTVQGLKALSKATGVNMVLFESTAEGRAAGVENGSFVSASNTIYLDINAGISTEAGLESAKKAGTLGYAMIRTAAHELTHFIEANSADSYAALKQQAKHEFAQKGKKWDELVKAKIESSAKAGERLTRQGAEAEVIADACEMMLQDASAIERIARQNPSLKDKIAGFIKDFVKKISDALRSISAGSAEAKALMDMRDGLMQYSEELSRLWGVALEEAVGNTTVEQQAMELSDAQTKFSIREEAPPKKTGIAYKVFFEKNGKLYPPMVANPGGADTPVGVWLNADVGTAAPPSKTGRLQVKAGGKGTQGGSGSLAFRPGWHLGDIPKATQFNRLNKATGVKELFPYNFVWAECEYAMDVDYQEEAMSYGYNANGKFQHSLAGLPRLPVDGYYHYRTNPDPNTVPWVITGAMKVNKILSRAEVDEILREKGVEPTKWQGPDGEQMEAEGEVRQYALRGKDVSYNSLISEEDMVLTKLTSDPSIRTREDLVDAGMKNALANGVPGESNMPKVHVDRENLDVNVSKRALRHGLDRRFSDQIPVIQHIGEILKNAIVVNTVNPRNNNTHGSYVLLGAGETTNGETVYALMVVNNHTNTLESFDALYSVRTQKRGAVSMTQALTTNGLSRNASVVSIRDMLNDVKDVFSDVLPTDVVAALGVQRNVSSITPYLQHSFRPSERVNNGAYSDASVADQSKAMSVVNELQTPDGQRMFSLRSMTEDYDTYKRMLIENGESESDISALFRTIDEVMRLVEENRSILDFGWNVGREDRSFSPVKPNSDPLYKVSVDFSTLCRKRLLQQAVQDRLEAKFDTVLTKAERVAVRNELIKLRDQGKQIEVACALCYVESTRLKSPAQIQRFFDDRRAVMVDYFAKKNKEYMSEIAAGVDAMIVSFGKAAGTKKKDLSSAQKKAVTDYKQRQYKKYRPSLEEEQIIETAMALPSDSFKTDKGLWNLKKEHEPIFDAYTSFVRNATKSKGIEADEAWWAGDSQSISDNLIEQMNAENGLRSQSWSDFQVVHLLDYIGAIIELSTRNAKMQTYTKVPDFVRLMGDTGAMINLSLIPDGYDGKLTYDPEEGMPIQTALDLRRDFPNTVGTICIGITDEHIRKLLASADIDYVIPYHSSSLDKKTRQQMGMKVWEDFQQYQTEKQRDYKTTDRETNVYHKSPKFSEWFDYDMVSEDAMAMGAEKAMQKAAERYVELCHRRGLQEKFAQFASEPNYWKLLIDRKMINQVTGEIIKQEAVKPRFDLDRIRSILSDEVTRFYDQQRDFDSAVDEIERLWDSGNIRKAAKSKKVVDAVKAFEDTVIVRNIVESAAELNEGERQMSQRLPDDISTREYLADADSSIAETAEQANALEIYKGRLKAYRDAVQAVDDEKAKLATTTDKAAAQKIRNRIGILQNQQSRAYDQLIAAEDTKHIRELTGKTTEFIQQYLAGKTADDVAALVAETEAEIASLTEQLSGVKGVSREQAEATKEQIRMLKARVTRLRNSATKKLLETRQHYQQMFQRDRTRREINEEANKKAAHIKRVVKRLNDRIMHEDDYHNVKQELQPTVRRLVEAFAEGFGSLVFNQKSADRLLSVYRQLDSLDSAESAFYSDDVEAMLEEISMLAEADSARRSGVNGLMENAEAKLEIYSRAADIADNIWHMVQMADEIFVDGKRKKFAAFGNSAGQELLAHKDYKQLYGAAGKLQRWADEGIRTGNMTPVYFFERLQNEGLSSLFQGISDAQTDYAKAILDGQTAMQEAKKRYNYALWARKEPVEITTAQKHTFKLTVEQMMWVYATAKREASNKIAETHHLSEGGFRFEGEQRVAEKGKGKFLSTVNKPHILTDADVAAITSKLTDEQRAYADEMVRYLSEDMAELGNRASMEMFGIRKYQEGYYFPFKTASEQRFQRSDAGSTSTTNDSRVKHSSFTHRLTKGANTTLVMGDFSAVVADHINQMATYASFMNPVESMNRVLNYKVVEDDGTTMSIRSLLGRKYGDAAQRYVQDFLKDINGGVQTDSRGAGGVNALIRTFKRGAVSASLSTALQQPTAYLRAFAYIDTKYFAHATGTGNKEAWDEAMRYSGTAVIKDMGKFDVGLGQPANEWIAQNDESEFNLWQLSKQDLDYKDFKTLKTRWGDFLSAFPGYLDRVTWTHIWKAVKAEQADLHPSMNTSSEEFLEMCGKRFDDVINHTQVYDSIIAKSSLMRSKNALHQMATAFKSEPTLTANVLYNATRKGLSKRQRAKMVTATLASNILAAAFAAAISAWNDDEDERNALEKYLDKFGEQAASNLNPLNWLPYISDISNLLEGYDVERLDMSVVADIISYTKSFFDTVSEGQVPTWKQWENFVGTLLNLAGVPAKNVSRDARRLKNAITSNWSATPTTSALWYTALENIPYGLYNDRLTAYYERYASAVVNGNKQEAYNLRDFLTTSKKKEASTIATGFRKALKEWVQSGKVAPEKATEILREYAPYAKDKDNISKPKEWAGKE